MKIFIETKQMVKTEKFYTGKILQNLMVIDRDKLYADLKYPSLHKYIVGELGYSEAEARLRVDAVRLMRKSAKAVEKITQGKMSLTNAGQAHNALNSRELRSKELNLIDQIVEKASSSSTRELKKFLDVKFKRERKEILVLKEYILKMLDRVRKKHNLPKSSNYELIEMMLEKELKEPPPAPAPKLRAKTKTKTKVRAKAEAEVKTKVRGASRPSRSRYIPLAVKRKVYRGQCANCGARSNLEYDHIKKFAHGGENTVENLQMLCRSCNGRKEIVAQNNLLGARPSVSLRRRL